MPGPSPGMTMETVPALTARSRRVLIRSSGATVCEPRMPRQDSKPDRLLILLKAWAVRDPFGFAVLVYAACVLIFLEFISWLTWLPLVFLSLRLLADRLPVRPLRAPARALASRAMWAAAAISFLIVALWSLQNTISPAWVRDFEEFVFDHRDTLDDLVVLQPRFLLPVIAVAGLVSFCRADARPINLLGSLLAVIGNVALFVYTLSFFTVFSVARTAYIADDVQAREIAGYRVAFEREKAQVGRYLAAQAVHDTLGQDATPARAGLLDLIKQVATANRDFDCKLHPALWSCTHPALGAPHPADRIEQILGATRPAWTGDAGRRWSDVQAGDFHTIADFRAAAARSEQAATAAQQRADALTATIAAMLDSLLDLGPDLNRYLKDALSQVLDNFVTDYVGRRLNEVAVRLAGFSDYLNAAGASKLLADIRSFIAQTVAPADAKNAWSTRFASLATQLNAALSDPVRMQRDQDSEDRIRQEIEKKAGLKFEDEAR